MMTKTSSEDTGIQCTSNIARVNAHRVGQTSCSTIHQSLHYIGLGYLFIHLVIYHLRLTVCRVTGPAAGEPIVSKIVLSLGHSRCAVPWDTSWRSKKYTTWQYPPLLWQPQCLKLVCYPTEADSCPSALLALKAVYWWPEMAASSLHSMSEDLHTDTPVSADADLLRSREQHGPMECWSLSPRTDVLQQRSRDQPVTCSQAKNLNSSPKTLGPKLLFLCFQIYWVPELRIDMTLEKTLLLIQVLIRSQQPT